MNMYLIIMEGKYGAIDNGDSSCHGYHIIKFSSSVPSSKNIIIIQLFFKPII